LALDLSSSKNHDILGEHRHSVNSQTWIPEFLLGGSGALIKSKQEGQLYIGFDGDAVEGKELIGVPRSRAKVWDLSQSLGPDHLFKLEGTHFVMEFPEHNLHPGTHAQLGVLFLGAHNQIWVVASLD